LKLNLGVLDVPELDSEKTTYDVAKILEEKYGLFTVYAEQYAEVIAQHISEDVAGSMETFLLTGKFPSEPLPQAADAIGKDFQKFIYTREAEGAGMPNVPTQAALKGVNRRLKIKKGARRPSFIDTGIMEASLKAWFE
jgi:hypothetical protein